MLEQARQAFASAQASRSLRTALASRLRPSSDTVYRVDDIVYFYSNADSIPAGATAWKKGRVVGFSQQAKLVSILHGSQVITRHVTKVRLASDRSLQPSTQASVAAPPVPPSPHPLYWYDDDNTPLAPADTDEPIDPDQGQNPNRHLSPVDLATEAHPLMPQDLPPVGVLIGAQPLQPMADELQLGPNSPAPGPNLNPINPQAVRRLTRLNSPSYTGMYGSSGGRQPKSPYDPTAQNEILVSEALAPHPRSHIESETLTDGDTETLIQEVYKIQRSRGVPVAEQGTEFDEAKRQEIQDWKDYGVVRECTIANLPSDHQVIDVRYICERKDKGGLVPTPTARLVALGYQENTGSDAVDAPTATRTSLKTLVVAAARNRWPLFSIDFKRAFLQARPRAEGDAVIAIIPPPEARVKEGHVWILEKSVYGLRSAPKEWWLTLMTALIDIGFRQSQQDLALFTFEEDDKVIGAMAIHVDDVLATGSDAFNRALDRVEQRFHTRGRAINTFTHLGLQYSRGQDDSVMMTQTSFIDGLQEIPTCRSINSLTPITADQQERVRTLIGGMLWLSSNTRMDIAGETSALAADMRQPTTTTLLMANKLVRYLKFTRHNGLHIPHMSGPIELRIYADAALLNRDDGRSQAGSAICVSPQTCPGSPRSSTVAVMGWRSSVLKRVVTSSFSAELVNLSIAFDEVAWTANLITDVLGHRIPVIAFSDCQSVVDNTKSLRLQVREKSLTRYMYYVRDMLKRSEIDELIHVPTSHMLADGLTRKSPKGRQALATAMQGSCPSPSHF